MNAQLMWIYISFFDGWKIVVDCCHANHYIIRRGTITGEWVKIGPKGH